MTRLCFIKSAAQILRRNKLRDEELFFLPILVIFSGFLFISVPFKTSLAQFYDSRTMQGGLIVRLDSFGYLFEAG